MSTVVFTLPTGSYGPVTHFKSPTYNVPAGVTEISIQFSLQAADIADPTKSFSMFMERFDSASGTWIEQGGFSWTGGGTDKRGNPITTSPSITFGVLANQTCRLDITTAQTFNNMSAQVIAEP